MTPFVFLSWDVDQAAAEHVAHKFKTTLRAISERWQILFDRPGALMAVKAGGRVSSRRSDGHPTFIIGDVFTRDGLAPVAPSATEQSFEDLCGSITTDCWGAYLALQIRDGGRFSLYRDPIGMRDSVCWTRSGVRVVASEPIPWLFLSAPSNLAIEWSCLAGLLGDSSTVFEVLPLTGIETVPTGTIVHFDSDRRRIRRIWQPSRFYRHEEGATAAEFRETLISCVRAWLAAYPDTMLEISGGFDSALVAVAGTGIKRGVNFFSDGLAGDERRYARDVSTRSRIPLDEIHMPVGRLGEADVQDMPIGIRPGLGSTTLFHDRLLARSAAAHGARAMLTGHGGDAVFFQHPTAEIAADPTFPRTDFRAHAALAKWSRESVWTVARHAFGISPKRAGERPSDSSASLPLGMTPALTSQWVGELDGLPPAKRGQIYGIAGDRSAFGTSWRSQVLTVLHPLLSQPLVEQAIATDTYLLTRGRRDRSLARDAFRDLLPPSVAERRGKGSLGHFFGRSLAASTPFLRSFLLDGVLAQNHVLDRAKLEPMLDRDFLMQFDCYGKLLSTIVMEQWARVWEDRLRAMRSDDTAPAAALQASPPANETHDHTGPEH